MFDRRSFLKVIGGGAVGVFLTPAPWKALYDVAYWTQNWGWIPRLKYGENAYTPTVSKLCPSGTGVTIRTVNGRPVRALGSEKNILSQGGVTALASTETQMACTLSRVKYPLKRTADGSYTRIDWAEAEQILLEKTQAAGNNITCVSGDQNGSINDLFSAFLNKLNSSSFFRMPCEEQNAQRAWEKMGAEGRIGYNIEKADHIFSIGANYLENWGVTTYNRKDYDEKCPSDAHKRLFITYAGPVQTNMAAVSDCFLPCKVQSELIIALGVAHLLLKKGAYASAANFASFRQFVEEYTPEKVASLTAIPADKFIKAVDTLAKARNPLVIVGSETDKGVGSLAIMAGIICNALLNKDETTNAGLLTSLPFPIPALAEADSYNTVLARDFSVFAYNVANDKIKAPSLLYLYEANPLYALPKNTGVDKLLEKSDYVISFSTFMNETSMKADLVLPVCMGFERFADTYTPYGSGFVNYAAGQPATGMAYESRPAEDVFFALASSLNIPFKIKNCAELIAMKAEAIGADMGDLLDGESFVQEAMPSTATLNFNTSAFAEGVLAPREMFAVYPSVELGLGTANTGIPPFSTKIIDNNQAFEGRSVAQMNKATADKLGVKDNDIINLTNDFGKMKVQALIFEGVQNDTFLMTAGLGHTAFDAFSQNKGENVLDLTGLVMEESTGATLFAPMYVNAKRG